MIFGLSTGLTTLNTPSQDVPVASGAAPVISALGSRDGFAIDFVRGQMRVNDSAQPLNDFSGAPEDRLTVFGADGYEYAAGKGLIIDPARDFSIALSTGLFPYNTAACTVYVKYWLNAPTSTTQRYLFMIDNAGVDRMATYAAGGQSFRFVTGDGTDAHIALTSLTHTGDTEVRAVFGVDANGKTYVDDAGVHVNEPAEILAASTPAHVGIGGYNDRVLRVLDGTIAEIMVVCEAVPREDRLTLDFGGNAAAPVDPPQEEPHAFGVLGARNGVAIDFVANVMRINDDVTPANAYEGDPVMRLTKLGADDYVIDPVKGLSIDAARDFSVALSTSLFPYNPQSCTVYAKYRMNAANTDAHRYLLMADNAGDDRFALYATTGAPFRFVTGDGSGPDIVVSDMDFVADTEYTVVFGADHLGKTFIDVNGVQVDDGTALAASTPSAIGIGGYNNQVLRVLDGYISEIVIICEPVPREARLTLDPFLKIYGAEGDSHTYNTNEATWGVGPEQFYAPRVTDALGAGYIAANFGWSGDSSAEMVHQLPAFFADGRPDIATIYAGANDGDIDIVADTTPGVSDFAVEYALRSRLEPGGHVVVNGFPTTIIARSGNVITVDPILPAAPSVGDVVEIDTQKNIETWVDAVAAKGVPHIAVIGYHFMNFANGGDTPSVEHPTRAEIRAAQFAAATTRNVPFIDTYEHMAQKITSGAVTQGDDLSWHVAVGNTHLNVAGEQAVADAVYDAFVALGWD